MKKQNGLASVFAALAVLGLLVICAAFISCSKIEEKGEDSFYTVTINSSNGTTTLKVDETSRMISRSVFEDVDGTSQTYKDYSYDSSNHLRSVNVVDPFSGRYSINYGEENTTNSRSVISTLDDKPKKIKKISKIYNSSARSASLDSEDETVEYFYDEDGNLTHIVRVDSKNNVITKGASNEE